MQQYMKCMRSGKPKTDIKMKTQTDVDLTKDQRQEIRKIVNRYIRMKRKKFIRDLYVWKKFRNN